MPLQDMVQLSFFRKNGELFLLANVAYDEEKNSFTISNVKGERARDAEKTELRLDENSVLTMNLSYIRHDKKRKTAPITDFTSATDPAAVALNISADKLPAAKRAVPQFDSDSSR